jgi:prophage antirepressor-like protein
MVREARKLREERSMSPEFSDFGHAERPQAALPARLDEAVAPLLDSLAPSYLQAVGRWPATEVDDLRIDLEGRLRSPFAGLGHSALMTALGTEDPDDAARAIVEALWRRLRADEPGDFSGVCETCGRPGPPEAFCSECRDWDIAELARSGSGEGIAERPIPLEVCRDCCPGHAGRDGESQTKAYDPDSLMALDFGGKPLRIILRDGEPWFIAKEVCDALGIQNTAQAIGRLDEDERGLCSIDTLGGSQELLIVSESGFYLLTLRCRDTMKPGTTAYAFRRWVTREVLPTIHKTGRYEVISKETPVAAPPVLPAAPLSKEAHYTLQDPLHRLFVDFTDRRLRAEGRKHHTVSLNYGRLLAWLWRHTPETGWLALHGVRAFARTVGLPSRTLRRIFERLETWKLVERRQVSRDPDQDGSRLPLAIRLDRAALREALAGLGLAVPETLPIAVP